MDCLTKILIADDHDVVVEGIKVALRDHPGFFVIGEAFDGRDVIRKVQTLEPDVIIMDISMPFLNGIDATIQIKKTQPHISVIIMSMYSNAEYIIRLIKAGISAYVVKDDPLSDIILAVNAAKRKGAYLSTAAWESLLEHLRTLEADEHRRDRFEELSLREREVFQLLVEGKKTRDIAKLLNISPKTVASHKIKIMGKLDVRSVSDLTKIAARKKLLFT